MDTGLRHYVHVQAVAQVDRVDVVAFQIRVHDGEEDLEEEVDGIEEDGEEEEPVGWSTMSVGVQEGWCRQGVIVLVVVMVILLGFIPCFAGHHEDG